ncbi:MAG: hypothetical protein DMF68_00680 [Acidobacteria bacterium]|nr:MAG: hypothetical protein DMF68_00680 [Acidobacteriota bacterium]
MRRKVFVYTSLASLALLVASAAVFAQGGDARYSLNCNDQGRGNDSRAHHCEVKEQTIQATALNVDGRTNGGISVKAWERNETLVRYRIQSYAQTQAEADSLASQIQVTTAGGQIRAEGPQQESKANGYETNWSVSYEIFVPRQSDLTLRTHNGGITIADVRGRISFDALNGGVTLNRLGGNVTGQTVNGGLKIELTGSNWEGEGLNVKTTNGGLVLSVPDNYSAHLETGTVNGHISVNPSIAQIERDAKELSVNLGAGGTNLRIYTTNGGVSIKRNEAR